MNYHNLMLFQIVNHLKTVELFSQINTITNKHNGEQNRDCSSLSYILRKLRTKFWKNN